MMGFRTQLLPLVLACLTLPVQAESTRYILAPAILQADPHPNPLGPDPRALAKEFAAAFNRSIPGLRPLSEQAMLDPNDPTILVVPRLTTVRLSVESTAGTLDRYEATLVGDVAMIDPWSNARLFTATRMVVGVAEMSRNHSETLEQDLRTAFAKAAQEWTRQCIEQIRSQAHPFTLKAAVLPAQSGVKLKGGGLWPFGSLRGVSKGRLLMGEHGKRARVREIAERFAVLEDPADPGRTLKPDESYQLVVVEGDNQAERTEPRMALRWVGQGPDGPDGATRQAIPTLGWLGLSASYLSKDGRFRLLPLTGEASATAQAQWQSLTEDLQRFSLNAAGNTMSAAQADWALKAQDDPDFTVEVGLVDTYHGVSRPGNGAVDQLFRARWAFAWFERMEDGSQRFRGSRFLSEETTVRTKAGVKELDAGSIWFNLCRNGLIKLTGQVLAEIKPHPTDLVLHQGRVEPNGTVNWDLKPGRSRRLNWLRPMGEVKDAAGHSLGRYLRPLGSLTLAEAKPEPGDEFQYRSSPQDPAVAGLLLPDLAETDWLLPPRWLQSLLASRLIKAAPIDLVCQDRPDQLPACARFIHDRDFDPVVGWIGDVVGKFSHFQFLLDVVVFTICVWQPDKHETNRAYPV